MAANEAAEAAAAEKSRRKKEALAKKRAERAVRDKQREQLLLNDKIMKSHNVKPSLIRLQYIQISRESGLSH